MHISFISASIFLLVLIAVLVACVKTGKLTFSASLAAGVTGSCVFAGAGYTGIALLGAFFVLGVLSTSHGKERKASISAEEHHEQQRKPGQVFANGGVAAIMALLALIFPVYADTFILMLAASLASAAADTMSSELGTIYGRNFYNVLSFKKDTRGLDGVVSLEGTLIGAGGALIIAIVFALGQGFDLRILTIVIAGVLGNLMDSLLGASLERKHYISNDLVNFLNTLFAAFIAWICR
ncbi:MAG TPA: DUF92 domain-containing protein [Chitinophaga sp.]|nr:DUF92 domain-containing protein [Chitinophaga sp.]